MARLSVKSKILLGAFLVAGLGAGAQEGVSMIAASIQQQYNWNNPQGTDPFTGTESQAKTRYGCTSGPADCAIGTPIGGGEELVLKKP